MVKRYEGNTGRMVRVAEPPALPVGSAGPAKGREPVRAQPPQGRGGALPLQLRRLLSGGGGLETEDLLLLLILYLLYRESGDQDWLVTLGAMLFFD